MTSTTEPFPSEADLQQSAVAPIEPIFWTPRRFFLAWLGIVSIFLLLRLPTLMLPFERDEGEYAYIAQQVIDGGVPYRDAFDQKPPGVFVVYLVAFLLMGQSVLAVHVMMGLCTLASAILLFKLVQRLVSTGAGLAAAFVLVIVTAERSVLGTAANTEIFMILPMIGSLLCLVPKKGLPKPSRLVAAGALSACAFWTKQVAATDAIFVAGWVAMLDLVTFPKINYRRLLLNQLFLAIGGFIVTAVIFLYFIFNGALHDFLYCVFTYNFGYATKEIDSGSLLLERFWRTFGGILAGDWTIWLALIGGLIVLGLQFRKNWRVAAFFAAFFVLSFLGACIGGYFRPHYFTQVLPAVSALAGIGLAWLLARMSRISVREIRWVLYGSLFTLIFTFVIIRNASILFAFNSHLQSYRIYGGTSFIFSRELGDELQSLTAPTDTILVAGTEPQIAFFSHRKNATRFIFFDPLLGDYPGIVEQQEIAISEIIQNNPAYIIDVIGPRGYLLAKPGITRLELFDKLDAFKNANYHAYAVWRCVGEGLIDTFPGLFVRLTPQEYDELNKQFGKTLGLTLVVYKRNN